MHPIFAHYQKLGAKWSQSPRPTLKDSAFDFSSMPWEENPELAKLQGDPSQFEIMFDGAQCLKFGKDIIMNVSTANHKLGHEWLKNHLGSDYNLHMVQITDHHIDGMFMPLRPGVLLINPLSMEDKMHLLPKELQKWDIIKVPEEHNEKNISSNPQLASANINVNVLPINEKQILIFDHDGDKKTILGKTLEKNGFEVIQVRLRHSRMFGGGVHCVTLDTVREGELNSYF
jgi:glycine amidinotransferase